METEKWSVRENSFNLSEDLVFQTLDWYNEDFLNEETDKLEYRIYTFGVNDQNKPVSLIINNFYPFFFIVY